MKRPWLLAVVFASCLCLSAGLILTLTPTARALAREDFSELQGYQRELYLLDQNPYTAYWMQKIRERVPRSEVELTHFCMLA